MVATGQGRQETQGAWIDKDIVDEDEGMGQPATPQQQSWSLSQPGDSIVAGMVPESAKVQSQVVMACAVLMLRTLCLLRSCT